MHDRIAGERSPSTRSGPGEGEENEHSDRRFGAGSS